MLTFRRADHPDVATIRHLAERIWRACYPSIIGAAQVEYMLAAMYSEPVIRQEISDGVQWEIAYNENEPVGFLSITREKGDSAKLNKLYLVPELHGTGRGQQLIRRSLEVAASLGARELWLQVNKRNERAIHAYTRAGFRVDREAVFKIGNGFVMDDFIMCRVVP